MKLLLDENLSPRLVGRLQELFGEILHVREVGLKQAADIDIWRWAKANSFTIISTDADFIQLGGQHGHPPKLIHLEQCDYPLKEIEEILRSNSLRISEFEFSDAGVLTLRPLVPGVGSLTKARLP